MEENNGGQQLAALMPRRSAFVLISPKKKKVVNIAEGLSWWTLLIIPFLFPNGFSESLLLNIKLLQQPLETRQNLQ